MFAVLLFAVILVSAAQDNEDQTEEYNTRRTICESGDQNMFREMEDCFQMEHEAVVAASSDCAARAVPSSEGDSIAFMNAACKDVSLFKQYDLCMNEYKANSTFESLMEITPEVEECYQKVNEKYNLENSKDYPKENSE